MGAPRTDISAFVQADRAPSTDYGSERYCSNGANCVTFSAGFMASTVLCRYNPGPTCFCCQERDRRRARLLKEAAATISNFRDYSQSELAEMMRNAQVAA